jgi:nucleotide-binding universal stress UspA family protein
MFAKTILYPNDFSKPSEAGLRVATAMARDTGAKLLIAHVSEPPAAYGGGEMYYGVPEPSSETLQRMLAEVAPTDTQVSCEHRLLTGDPATEIVRLAKEEDVDLIVMATHGRTGLRRMLMGSVAEAVVRHAECPVLTLKEPQAVKAKRATPRTRERKEAVR